MIQDLNHIHKIKLIFSGIIINAFLKVCKNVILSTNKFLKSSMRNDNTRVNTSSGDGATDL